MASLAAACADDRADGLGKAAQAVQATDYCLDPVLVASWVPPLQAANLAEHFDAHRLLSRPITLQLPREARVDRGGAAGTATLTLSLGGQTVERCTYTAGEWGSEAPNRVKKPKKSGGTAVDKYSFTSCEHGSSQYGVVEADELTFRLNEGDEAHGTTTARLETFEPAGTCLPVGYLAGPPIDPARPTRFIDLVRHIFTGPTAVQLGVVANAIPDDVAGAIRGRVLDEDGAPFGQAQVTIVGHPEYGSAYTNQGDGSFHLVVRGGGDLMVLVHPPNGLPIRRHVEVPVGKYALTSVDGAPLDLVVVRPEPCQSWRSVDGAQYVWGKLNKDVDGSRRGALYLPSGLQPTTARHAENLCPRDQPSIPKLDEMCVSITEHSVGPLGPARMPAELNPTSAYTHAVALTVAGHEDEQIYFTGSLASCDWPAMRNPVYYVHNFLRNKKAYGRCDTRQSSSCPPDTECVAPPTDGLSTAGTCQATVKRFPVGTIIPNGIFETDVNRWAARDSGRVIALLGIKDGLAEIDADDKPGAEDATTLRTKYGITEEERRTLAMMMGTVADAHGTVFKVGDEVWRVPIQHFSTPDLNKAVFAPVTASAPKVRKPGPTTEDDPFCVTGSIIECENATLGERVPLNGAPFNLVYRSDRVEDNPLPYGADLNVGPTDKKALDKLLRIDVTVDVAGRRWTHKLYPSDPEGLLNRVLHIQWDGLNIEGKRVRGAQVATVTVSYAYEATFTGVPTFGLTGAGAVFARTSASGSSGGGSISTVAAPVLLRMPARREVQFTTKLDVTLGTFDWSGLGFGGWGIDKYHAWGNGKVFLGTGGVASPGELAARVARRVPGVTPHIAFTGPASTVSSLGVTSNGAQYFVSGGKLWRHLPDATSSVELAVGSWPVHRVAITRDDEIFACAGSPQHRHRAFRHRATER
ncbi:MAG: hypothetical protein HYV09_12780 [Deltaproteobacteria bacterium]|nr:hypothetical protein [Deltaproteobacteria bacterium]